jgi:flagellar hook-associated protein 1
MSGLFGVLNSSVKALSAQSFAVETASRNLANVNNPNYARQRVVLGDRGTVQTSLGAQSLGLEALGIEQLRDQLLDSQVTREVAMRSFYEAQQMGYKNAEAGLGEQIDRTGETDTSGGSSDGVGISAALTTFFNSFQSFAASPTDPGERETLIQQAGVLVDRMHNADSRLAQVQSDLSSQISTDIDDANTLITQISDLNDQIGRMEINRPGSAVDLRDQRQAKLEALSKKIAIETQNDPAASGRIQIFVRDASNAPVVLLDYSAPRGPLSISGSTVSGGTPSTAISLGGGSIKGSLSARDTGIANLRTDLNSLAQQLVTSVNGAYSPSGANFFATGGTTAGTIALNSGLSASTLKSTIPAGAAGDNDIALAVAALASRVFATSGGNAINGTFTQHYSRSVSSFGQTLATSTANVKQQTTVEAMVRNQRDSISGVSLDEEMADLLKYQRSFQAASKVVAVIDELLDTVVNRMGL